MGQAIIYDLEEFNAQLESEFAEDEVIVECMGIDGDTFSYPYTIKDKDFLYDICKIYKNRGSLAKEEEQLINMIANRFI